MPNTLSFEAVQGLVAQSMTTLTQDVRNRAIRRGRYLINLGLVICIVEKNSARRRWRSGASPLLGGFTASFFKWNEAAQAFFYNIHEGVGISQLKEYITMEGCSPFIPTLFPRMDARHLPDAPEVPARPRTGWRQDYSSKPKPLFNGYMITPKKKAIYAGWEIEILKQHPNNGDEIYRDAEVIHKMGYTRINVGRAKRLIKDELLYAKYDGSIGSYGMELVSHPMDVPTWITKGMERFSKIKDYVLAEGYLGHNIRSPGSPLGFHIHVTRPETMPIGGSQGYNMMKYYEKYFPTFFEKVNRRGYVGYAQCNGGEYNTNGRGVGRSAQINWQTRKTIEFRGGRSTLSLSTVQSAIELYVALVDTFANDRIPSEFMDIPPLDFMGGKLTDDAKSHLRKLATVGVPEPARAPVPPARASRLVDDIIALASTAA